MTQSGFDISSSSITHPGHVRSRNEDSILSLDTAGLWLVADGMGGHHAGEFASQTITQNLSSYQQQESLKESILLLEENILHSNAVILEKSKSLGKDVSIGSTLVCALIWQNYLFTFWAGDSRLYRYQNNRLERLTTDHSYVEELVRMGKIQARDAESHPAANVILKAVGIEDDLRMDFNYFEIANNDTFIICSDGLYKDVDEEMLASIIANHSSDETHSLSESLLSWSLQSGGTDNTSIITLKATQRESDV